jgi:hypothetical protein
MTFPQTPHRPMMLLERRAPPTLRVRGFSAACGLIALSAALGCANGALAATPGDPTVAPPAWIATQPPGAISDAGEAAPEMQVTLTSRSRRLAVINGQVVKVGDEYKGAKVRAIKAGKVEMDDAEKSLSMAPDVKKSAPKMAKGRKKSVVIPADNASPKVNRSNQ